MANDYLSGSQFGQVAGTLLARRRRQDKDQAKRALFASALFETFGAFQRRQKTNLNQDLTALGEQYKGIFEDYQAKYDKNEQNRTDLMKFDSQREQFLNKKSDELYDGSDLRKINNFSSSDIMNKGTKDEQQAYLDFIEEQKKDLINKYEDMRKNPFVSSPTFTSLTAPVTQELIAKANQLKDDPARQGLFFSAIDKIFGDRSPFAGKQAKLAAAVDEASLRRKNEEERIKAFDNYFKQKYIDVYQPNKLEATRPNLDLEFNREEVEKTIDYLYGEKDNSFRKKYEDMKVPLMDSDGNVYTESTPFDRMNEIKVQTRNLETGVWEFNKDKNAKSEFIDTLGILVEFEKQREEALIDAGEIQYGSPVDKLIENSIIKLAEQGYLLKEGGQFKIQGGKIIFRVPENIAEISQKEWFNNDEMINVVNSINEEANESLKNQIPSSDNFTNDYLEKQLELSNNQLTKNPENVEIQTKIDKLSDMLRGEDNKSKDAEFIKLLIKTPEELMDKKIQVKENEYITLGRLNTSQLINIYNRYKGVHGPNFELEQLLLDVMGV